MNTPLSFFVRNEPGYFAQSLIFLAGKPGRFGA